MSTEIKQMLGSVVIFSKIGFSNCFVSVIKLRLGELGQILKTFLLLVNCFAHPNKEKFIMADGKKTTKVSASKCNSTLTANG